MACARTPTQLTPETRLQAGRIGRCQFVLLVAIASVRSQSNPVMSVPVRFPLPAVSVPVGLGWLVCTGVAAELRVEPVSAKAKLAPRFSGG